MKKILPWIVVAITLLLMAAQLHHQGRRWICACGYVRLWTSGAWTSDNSQHWFDPYSLTHILHGFAFCGLLTLLPRMAASWRFAIAIAAECLWEIIENTNTVIQRYREATAALGYQGDSIINSMGDVIACAVGFWLARQLGWRRSSVVFIAIELILIFWIHDSLILEIVMLLFPNDVIRGWQMAH